MSQTETGEQPSLTNTVHTAPVDIPVKDVARLMTARGIGSVVVVDGQTLPIGIITDRDIVVRVTAPGQDAMAVSVGSVMSTPLVTITEDQDLEAAIGVMVRHGIRRLPIVDETGRLASILTMEDILRFKLADPAALAQIVRDRPQPLPPEALGKPSGIASVPSLPPAHVPVPTGVFETDLAFKPGVPSDIPVKTPTGFTPGTAASVNPRPLAAVAKSSAIVPMVKRRRRRTLLEEVRHRLTVNKGWVRLLLAVSAALIVASYFLA